VLKTCPFETVAEISLYDHPQVGLTRRREPATLSADFHERAADHALESRNNLLELFSWRNAARWT
jgi:hypothetical protein